MSATHDVIVVGARVAGAATALLLARRGLRVLLIDRSRFPSDTLSTHMIHESGIARLGSWDPKLVDAIRASGCPPIVRSFTDVGRFAYGAEHLPVGGNREAFAPRRTVLDKLLVDAAVAAGCELRERLSLKELIFEGDRVRGIVAETRSGARITERATLVVGADGRRSRVARLVRAPEYDTRPVTTCTYYTYFGGTGIDRTEVYPRPGGMMVAVPTNDGLAVVTVIRPIAELAAFRADVERSYFETIELAPRLAERVRAGRRAARFAGTGDLPFFHLRPYGPGWALVGDAGLCKDPIIAQGISDAFRDAESLASAVLGGLSGSEDLEASLRLHERRRNDATRDIYEHTFRLSLLRAFDEGTWRLYAACRDDPPLASRYHGVISGAVRHRDFYSDPRVRALLQARDERPREDASPTMEEASSFAGSR